MKEETKLRIEINNKQPVELTDLTQAFLSLGEQYERFLSKHPELGLSEDVKLYIKEIKTGSIITELYAFAVCGIPFAENANSVIQFTNYLRTAYYYFLGKNKKEEKYEKNDYDQLAKIIGPVAKDNGSQINFNTISTGDVNYNFYLGSIDANAIQNAIRRELEQLETPKTNQREKVVLYLWQARKDIHSQTGDRGIIESISPKHVKIIFADEDIKKEMLLKVENPFLSAYVVNVEIETIDMKPVLYKITRFYERLNKPD